MKSPYPYMGGKSKVASEVWNRFGNVDNYVEPFFGSGAVLLGRTDPFSGNETVNDLDGLISNFWRAVKADAKKVAEFADWPVNENDLHARHAWLVGHKESLQARIEGDPDFYDAKVAGWWVWGTACWIGSGFCSGDGPWRVQNGELVKTRPHCATNGQGVNRQLVHVGDDGQGIHRKRERLTGFAETGVNACDDLIDYFDQLCRRMRRVRVCCGDWSRVCGPSVTWRHGVTAVFLDPPYADTANRNPNLYRVDSETVAHDVREWAIEQGKNPLMRIALCGYDGEHEMPADWKVFGWKRVWFSPACMETQPSLFA